jgi:hypothetical protein
MHTLVIDVYSAREARAACAAPPGMPLFELQFELDERNDTTRQPVVLPDDLFDAIAQSCDCDARATAVSALLTRLHPDKE